MYQPDSASSGWYEALRYDFEYTAMGQVSRLTTSYKTDSASALHIAEDEVATWTSAGMLSSIHYMSYHADTVYQRSGYVVHFSSVNGLPDTAVHADTTYSPTGILTGYYLQTIKYNGLNDPIKIDGYWNSAPVATDTPFITKYYYYEFPESISSTILPQLAIHPNPANDQLFFTKPNSVSGNERVTVYDLEGRIIKAEPLNDGTMNIASLRPGTYLLVLTDGAGVKARQTFVKL